MASPNTRKKKTDDTINLYNTPSKAMEGLDKYYPEVFDQFKVYYDPCNGLGKISNYLKERGHKVYTSDKIDYGLGDTLQDFLKLESIPDDVNCIIFNPPFLLTEEFVDHAIKLCRQSNKCRNVLMFNRLNTLESISRGNKFYHNKWNLDTAYIFSYRVSCTEGINEKPTRS